jgi:hypothetical protein
LSKEPALSLSKGLGSNQVGYSRRIVFSH